MDYGYDDQDEFIQDGKRRRLSQEDAEILLNAFNQNPKPGKDERNELASILGMNSRTIQIWFQNRRAKLKKESNDPDLFTKKTVKESKRKEEIVLMPQVTAGNFKELCLPKYLDIPIRGQQLTTEDMYKNDAIRKFWQRQQEKAIEGENESFNNSPSIKKKPKFRKYLKISPATTPPRFDAYKKEKFPPLDENFLKPVNMPNILSCSETSNIIERKKSNGPLDYTNLAFLTKSIKEINTINFSKKNFYKPNLDSMATNLDFLFDPNRNAGSLDLLGSSTIPRKQPAQQLDQVFSEFFSPYQDENAI